MLTRLLGIFDLVPGWLYVAALAATSAAAGLQIGSLRHDLVRAKGEVATERAARLQERSDAQAAALAQAAANAQETARRLRAQQESEDAYQKRIALVRADAARADAVAGQLREQVAAFVAAARRAAPGDPAAAHQCAPAYAAVDLLDQLQRRIDDAAGELAKFADASRAAGLNCEARYDTLSPPSAGNSP